MMMGIQFLAPSHLPAAAEGGWNSTKVMKNKLTAKFRSSGWAPMSLVKPVAIVNYIRQAVCCRLDHLVSLRCPHFLCPVH